MFRKSPYWGWLLLAVVLCCAAWFRYHQKQKQARPAQMAAAVARDLQVRTRAFQALGRDTALVQRLLSGHLSAGQIEKLEEEPYYLFAWKDDSLLFWNTNELLPPVPRLQGIGAEKILDLDGRIVLPVALPISDPRLHVIGFIPIARTYLVENKYLSSGFWASDAIPASSRILDVPEQGALPVKNAAGQVLFYLQVPVEDIQPWIPDALMVVLCLAALLSGLVWVQLLILLLTRKKNFRAGILMTVLLVTGLRALVYKTGLPFHLENLRLFSSELYGYNSWLPSLGDLLLNVLCAFWIVVFVLVQSPYRGFMKRWSGKWYAYIIAPLLVALLTMLLFALVPVLRSVVVDSQLSFDVSRFHTIDWYTILGLFIISFIVSIAGLVIHFVNILAGNLLPRRWLKYLVVLVVIVAVALAGRSSLSIVHIAVAAWIFLCILLLDLRGMTLKPDLFSPVMIFWSVFICASVTALMVHYILARERDKDRIAFASHVVARQDLLMEYNFTSLADHLQKDAELLSFIQEPDMAGRSRLNAYLNAYYFSRQISQYQPSLYIFDAQGKGLYNPDTTGAASLEERMSIGMPSEDLRLYFNESAADDHYYLAKLPVEDSLGHEIAVLYLDLALKQTVNETLYPELLQPAGLNKAQGLADYDYAVYADGHLKKQKGDYSFPVSILPSQVPAGDYEYRKGAGGGELWYKDQRRLVIVAGATELWLETSTLFSYLFGLQILVSFIVMLYRMTLEYFLKPRGSANAFSITLRRRIHFSMLAMVVVSFLVIGSVTIYFFKSRYESTSYTHLQNTVRTIERQLLQLYSTERGLDEEGFKQLCRSTSFRGYFTAIAENQNTDLSIFGREGHLLVASQEDLYDKDLLAPLMRADAFAQMKQGRSILLQREQIGSLGYSSCYVALRNDRGQVLGYLNVPFFSSERELNDQISGILIALINLYAFLLLISSLLTLLITNGLTRTLNVIIRQFERVNLQRNELLEWPYNDEIGLLVTEYNKMVRKVEEHASMLAQSEREGAWREMARQVAHEIKNPLTPMKLNIQYLQQALKNNHPRLQELTERVSNVLIEQIDHLSHIASEFSNFAKMPDARPKVLDISRLLVNTVDLFREGTEIKIELEVPPRPVYVYTDHGQLIRVYTNLLQNAIQALEEVQDGCIEVKLLEEDGYAYTLVTDNGPGIPEEIQEKLFKPYFTTKSSGTGLGLAMTRKIVELWKGSIWFDTRKDEGTTFFVKLPVSAEPPAED